LGPANEMIDSVLTIVRRVAIGRQLGPAHCLSIVPEGALAQDLGPEPARTYRQGDLASLEHGRRLSLPTTFQVVRLDDTVPFGSHDEWAIAGSRYLARSPWPWSPPPGGEYRSQQPRTPDHHSDQLRLGSNGLGNAFRAPTERRAVGEVCGIPHFTSPS
jgi:hypothetical protein